MYQYLLHADQTSDCKEPFNLLEGVGCILVDEDSMVPYSEANDVCSPNSKLFSPATMKIFENLMKHLETLYGKTKTLYTSRYSTLVAVVNVANIVKRVL